MSELHNNHNPGYIPQIGVPDKKTTSEARSHRAIYHKATAPGFFGVIILCFFMSFINIRCNGHLVDHYSGFDIIKGKRSAMDTEDHSVIIACKNSAYRCMEKKRNGEILKEENTTSSSGYTQGMFDIPKNIDETSSNPKTTRLFAIIALICAAAGAVLSLLKKYWGAFSQFFIGTLGFVSLFLMQFYIKVTMPKATKPGAPLFSEYEAPLVTTELAFGYWLALFLFLGVSVIGFLRIRYLRKTDRVKNS